MTDAETVALLAYLADLLPDHARGITDEDRVEAWRAVMHDTTYAEAREVMEHLGARWTEDWRPGPQDFRGSLSDVRARKKMVAARAALDSAEVSWPR